MIFFRERLAHEQREREQRERYSSLQVRHLIDISEVFSPEARSNVSFPSCPSRCQMRCRTTHGWVEAAGLAERLETSHLITRFYNSRSAYIKEDLNEPPLQAIDPRLPQVAPLDARMFQVCFKESANLWLRFHFIRYCQENIRRQFV